MDVQFPNDYLFNHSMIMGTTLLNEKNKLPHVY